MNFQQDTTLLDLGPSNISEIATSADLGWQRITAVVEKSTAGYVEPDFVSGIEVHIQLGSGSVVWWSDGGPYRMSPAPPGKTVIMRQKPYSKRVWACEAEYLRLSIPQDLVEADNALAGMVAPGHWVLPGDRIQRFGPLILDELRTPVFHGDLIIETLFGAILGNSGTPGMPTHSLSPTQMRGVIEYLIEQHDQTVRVGDLAKVAGMSHYAFSRAFKASTGYAPYEFVLRLKVERAKSLLRDHRNTGAIIAAAMGYHDESHFSHTFKRLTGTTPSEWRNEIVGN